MPNYIVLYKFTDEGAKDVKSSVQRVRDGQAESERRGFKVHGAYWTMGQYDLVVIVEAPDESAMLNGLFSIAEAGNVRSETLRALTAEEMERAFQRT